MKNILRHLKVFFRLAIRSIQRDMAYRLDFFSNLLSSLGWLNLTLAIVLIFNKTAGGFGGWNSDEMLLLTGSWMINNGLAYFFFYRNMKQLVKDIHNGDLDLIVTKPVDSQFFVSFRRVILNSIAGPIEGVIVIVIALSNLNITPNIWHILSFILLVITSLIIYYSLWFFAASLTIHFTLADNLFYAVPEAIDTSKYPASAYPKAMFYILQTIVPLAVMTTFPALTIQGRLSWQLIIYAVFLAVIFFFGARSFWFWSLKKYTSASS